MPHISAEKAHRLPELVDTDVFGIPTSAETDEAEPLTADGTAT
jgi:hypothetical protein